MSVNTQVAKFKAVLKSKIWTQGMDAALKSRMDWHNNARSRQARRYFISAFKKLSTAEREVVYAKILKKIGRY